MNCNCGTILDINISTTDCWHNFCGMPVHCFSCDNIIWIDYSSEKELINIDQVYIDDIPPINTGVYIYLFNKEHPRHLDPGIIVNKDHIHYRIKFNDNLILWVPEHWVRAIPNEML